MSVTRQASRRPGTEMAKGGHRWGVAPYLERRDTLLGDCPQMVAEQRFLHLGLDVIVPLGTPLHAPLDAIVETTGYEAGEGNYGGYVLLRHENPLFETFYSIYGHLCKSKLPARRKIVCGRRGICRDWRLPRKRQLVLPHPHPGHHDRRHGGRLRRQGLLCGR